jgi:putative oxidoreductase
VLAGVIQLAGGLLIAVGWMTRWASAAVGGLLLIQVWTMHLAWGFFLNWTSDPVRGHGVEYALVLCGALLCLALGGAGDLSIDGRRLRRADTLALQRARIRRKF